MGINIIKTFFTFLKSNPIVKKIIGKIRKRKCIEGNELDVRSEETAKQALELLMAYVKLGIQVELKQLTANMMVDPDCVPARQDKEKGKPFSELTMVNKELAFQNRQKEKLVAELIAANKKLLFQTVDKEKEEARIILLNKELALQNAEKEKLLSQLTRENNDLVFQNREKQKKIEDLIISNKRLLFENEEIQKRATESEIRGKEGPIKTPKKENDAIIGAARNDLQPFSYSVSHDLQAPLQVINSLATILAEYYREQLGEEAKNILDEIMCNSKKAQSMIDKFFVFARIASERVSMADVNIQQLVEGVISDLQQKGQTFKPVVIFKNLVNTRADRNMLRQVFMHLIANALKYTGKTKEAIIEIGSYRQNKGSVYYVKDNGAGFNMKYYDKLFGVFQRLHGGSEFEGIGVGLAIARTIMSKHRGKIWAEAIVGEGACFYISLPDRCTKRDGMQNK